MSLLPLWPPGMCALLWEAGPWGWNFAIFSSNRKCCSPNPAKSIGWGRNTKAFGKFAAGIIKELAELGHWFLAWKPKLGPWLWCFAIPRSFFGSTNHNPQGIMTHCVTLTAHGVQLRRGESGVQWQQYEEQSISLCFSKIVVCDADYEVKMKDILCCKFPPPFFK